MITNTIVSYNKPKINWNLKKLNITSLHKKIKNVNTDTFVRLFYDVTAEITVDISYVITEHSKVKIIETEQRVIYNTNPFMRHVVHSGAVIRLMTNRITKVRSFVIFGIKTKDVYAEDLVAKAIMNTSWYAPIEKWLYKNPLIKPVNLAVLFAGKSKKIVVDVTL
jgi:hypothetical protein